MFGSGRPRRSLFACNYVFILQMALLSYWMKTLVLFNLTLIILPKPPLCPTQNLVGAILCREGKKSIQGDVSLYFFNLNQALLCKALWPWILRSVDGVSVKDAVTLVSHSQKVSRVMMARGCFSKRSVFEWVLGGSCPEVRAASTNDQWVSVPPFNDFPTHPMKESEDSQGQGGECFLLRRMFRGSESSYKHRGQVLELFRWICYQIFPAYLPGCGAASSLEMLI